MAIVIGDQVRLISGGPRMTVMVKGTGTRKGLYLCAWFRQSILLGSKISKSWLHEASLSVVRVGGSVLPETPFTAVKNWVSDLVG